MGYTKTVWVNDETLLNASNLNHIENGIFNVSSQADDLEARLYNIETQHSIDSCHNILDPYDNEKLYISLLTKAEYEELEQQGKILPNCYHIFRDDDTIELIWQAINTKQNQLVSGTGIQIVGNIISGTRDLIDNCPTNEDGTFVRKCIVTNGIATYIWVKES